ncbi:multicopper oxidase domain-containing protein [Pelotalea chapellei]|uniref:Multicopper oxidase domain-containing protein n=1 Tax=Pelotalea chapellei TaxID=44671 RepID=A0ABS5U823_9BACT|nr:multicopper oxidase domain-containing protein [Pelotalea chapellei]MBT1071811.1 multicopper oxidase domain-containing protein [Pelotalea chapellei]
MSRNRINVRSAATIGMALSVFVQLDTPGARAQPVPGGTLDPTTIPKYVTPLVIPPVMPKSTTQPGTPAADYNIAVRQFKQQILPGGVWNTVNGRNDSFAPTTVWSYGRAQDNLPANFTAPVPLSQNITFNYPALTVENSSGIMTKVRWINDLKDADGNFLPHLFPVDQTLHWANPPAVGCADGSNHTDCMTMNPAPYKGPVPLVTHVHGSHVNPESDGYPEAWWLPAAKNIPPGYAKRGSKFTQFDNSNTVPGSAFYGYENNQPAATLWYHDHALGMTRNNVMAGPAGFWLVRGGINGDSYVKDNNGNAARLPGPAPKTGLGDPNFTASVRVKIREIPVAIQDRSFNADGSLFVPSNRAFFEGLNVPGQPPQFPGAGILEIPYIPISDIAPIWNPEVFYNTMVVNGTTWPQLEVAPALYRLRLLDGCTARSLNLALKVISSPEEELVGTEIPFYQIGAEQGFLPKVAMISTGFSTPLPGNGTTPSPLPADDPQRALLMMPAERADVLIDFSDLPNGTIVRMINTAPDFPFNGFPIAPADQADPETSGQVMQFKVNNALKQPGDDTVTEPEKLVLPAEGPLGPASNTRQVTLNEEESAVLCVQSLPDGSITTLFVNPGPTPSFAADCAAAGGFPFGPKAAKLGILATDPNSNSLASIPLRWMDGVTETPLLNATEEWEIFNTTVDAHPIHLHLVRVLITGRQDFDPLTFAPIGSASPAQPNEKGYKDTVAALPGQITRIKAKFDVPGEYVWHCHIVDHEDNEMMRPYVVRFDPKKPDFNQDGKVDNTDYSILLAEIRKTTLRNPAFDLNSDGKVDLLDAKFFYNVMKGI